jgi:cytochrome c oxidase cbb3-type subunit 3
MNKLFTIGIVLIVALLGFTFYYIFTNNIDLGDSVNLITALGAIAIITLTVFVSLKYINQMKNDKASGDLAEDNWDGIGEFKNPIPAGWAMVFIGTLIWLLWYWFFGYPLNAYSQIGEYNEDVAAHQAKFEAKWANPSADDLMGMGEGIFLVQCAPCHGIDGAGINGKAASFDTWGAKAGIVDVIKNGSKGLGYPMGIMPAGLLSGAAAEEVAAYVAGGMQGEAPATFGACAACHGPDGKGMGGMSPDLTTYGKPAFVTDVLHRGKDGQIGKMPSFKGRLTPVQEKAVAAYILSLNK